MNRHQLNLQLTQTPDMEPGPYHLTRRQMSYSLNYGTQQAPVDATRQPTPQQQYYNYPQNLPNTYQGYPGPPSTPGQFQQPPYHQPLVGLASPAVLAPFPRPAGPIGGMIMSCPPQRHQEQLPHPSGSNAQGMAPSQAAPAPATLDEVPQVPSHAAQVSFLVPRTAFAASRAMMVANEVCILPTLFRRMNIRYGEHGEVFRASVCDMRIGDLREQLTSGDSADDSYIAARVRGTRGQGVRLPSELHLFDALNKLPRPDKGRALELIVHRAKQSAKVMGLQTN